MDRKAIIIIDMLNDFVTGQLKCERAQHIIPNIKKLVLAARQHGVPVIYTNDAHLPIDEEVVAKWGKHAIKGTKGAEVIPELEPTKKDYVVEKRTYSSFYETGLDMLLRSLCKGEGVKTVVLTGLHTNMCVRHTAADAFFRGYKIIIAEDGVEAFTEEDYVQGLAYLKNVYNAKIMTTDKIIKEFSQTCMATFSAQKNAEPLNVQETCIDVFVDVCFSEDQATLRTFREAGKFKQ